MNIWGYFRALLIGAGSWKRSKCLSVGDWLDKMWSFSTMTVRSSEETKLAFINCDGEMMIVIKKNGEDEACRGVHIV